MYCDVIQLFKVVYVQFARKPFYAKKKDSCGITPATVLYIYLFIYLSNAATYLFAMNLEKLKLLASL